MDNEATLLAESSPVAEIPADSKARPLDEGTALCLSGGGYRAMLFHAGALWRLYEANLLKGLKRISSVSGGSITAGVLGLAWSGLSFAPEAVERRLCPAGCRSNSEACEQDHRRALDPRGRVLAWLGWG